MGVGILFGGTSVGGPAGVSNSVSAIERLGADDFFQIAQLAFGATDLETFAIASDRDSRGIIAAIFQLSKALDDDRDDVFLPHISDNSAHSGNDLLARCWGSGRFWTR